MSLPRPVATGRSRAFEPDRVVGVLATDGYHLHQLVYATFAHGGARRFLFCPVAVAGPAYRVRVRPCDVETCGTGHPALRITKPDRRVRE